MQTILNTAGDGLWSRRATEVKIVDIAVTYLNDEKDFGELRVYFDTREWNVDKDGLIYTDKRFLDDLKDFLWGEGFNDQDVNYSEQGMQGDNYVSLDVGAEFIRKWEVKFGEIVVA
jgi:hypothetical protein